MAESEMASPAGDPSRASRAALLDRLATGPSRLAETAGVAPAAPTRRDLTSAAPAPWSARDNVAHLVLVERLVFQARLDQLAAGETPTWSWTEPGTSDDARLATLEAALAAFADARAATLARVRGLDDAGWRRFGYHATYGRLDVAGLLEIILDHDEHHREDIAALARQDLDR